MTQQTNTDSNDWLDEIFSKSGWKYSKPKNTFHGWWKKSRPSFMQNQMTEAEMRNLKQAIQSKVDEMVRLARIDMAKQLLDKKRDVVGERDRRNLDKGFQAVHAKDIDHIYWKETGESLL